MSGRPAGPVKPVGPAGASRPVGQPVNGLAEHALVASAVPHDVAVRQFTLGPGVHAAFTGRRGGISQPPYDWLNMGTGSGDSEDAVASNRKLVATACGLTPVRMIWMRQVHGVDVGHVTDPAESESGRQPPVDPDPTRDASFTSVPELALCVLSADCPAVLVADPDAGIVGAAHSGRQGTARGVVPALVRAMSEAGADPARMCAVIGPAICGGCYEVPREMRDNVAAAVPGAGCVTRAGTPGLDLRAGISAQLADLGVRQLRVDSRCTAEERDLYSYRRDGRTGRLAARVWLAP